MTTLMTYKEECESLLRQIAAAQSREQQLRSALDSIEWKRKLGGTPTKYQYEVEVIAHNSLAQPTDTTTLQALIQQAGEVMLERCHACYNTIVNGEYWINAESIRALPGVTLEDLQ